MKNTFKAIESRIGGQYTTDGAGVRLLRVFGGPTTFQKTDPFLLMDYFGSSNPREYEKGFPWHPHRGIETITFQIKGKTNHEDSNGNRGAIHSGDVQDMISGSGIFHEEMPDIENESSLDKEVLGLQLWLNTPSNFKMAKPRYASYGSKGRERIVTDGGSKIDIIAGKIGDAIGSFVSPYRLNLSYFHIHLRSGDSITLDNLEGQRSIMFAYTGNVNIGIENIRERTATVFSIEGQSVQIDGLSKDSDLIFISGQPTYEHIEWYGPIVMNTRDQLREAINDLSSGSFVREKDPEIITS